jgi:hypothetical protein
MRRVGEEGRKMRKGRVRTHHEGVYEDVVVLEGVECRRGGDSVLASLAELEPRHNGGERAEHRVVEHLHGRPLARPPARSREMGGWTDSIGGGGWQWGEVLRFIRALPLGFRAGQRSDRVVPARAAPRVQSAVRCLRVKIPRREVEWPHRSVSVRAPNLWPARTCRWVGLGLGVPHRTPVPVLAADGSCCVRSGWLPPIRWMVGEIFTNRLGCLEGFRLRSLPCWVLMLYLTDRLRIRRETATYYHPGMAID